tara:strand:- start:470 stop:625 length:156 start_codon:yes stop_codon:yes gene_type:complete
VAESGTLLRCYTREGIGGSNPPLSARELLALKRRAIEKSKISFVDFTTPSH